VNFGVHHNATDNGKSTLSIVISLPGGKVPDDLNKGAAAAEMKEGVQGRYVLARDVFFGPILEMFRTALEKKDLDPKADEKGEAKTTPTDAGWALSFTAVGSIMNDTEKKIKLLRTDARSVNISLENSDPAPAHGEPKPISLQSPGQQQTNRLYYYESEGTAEGRVFMYTINWPFTATMSIQVGGGGKVAFEPSFVEGTVSDDFKKYRIDRDFPHDYKRYLKEDFRKKASGVLQKIEMAFTHFPSFVLPGADAFFFKSQLLDEEANLCLDLTVKSPH
jgi:hypothetical protein